VTQLSPEPWAIPAEPEIWRPPPPPKRSAVPYALGGAGVTALVAVALAIIFWPSSNGGEVPPANSPAQQAQASASVAQSESAGDPAPKLNQQAGQVDTLLTEMAGTRVELGSVVTGGCQSGPLEQIRSQRQEQLAKAQSLEVDALENGADLRDALVRALQASVESNQRYLDAAPGCPTDDEVRPENERASQAKSEFIEHWRPNAERTNLAVRGSDDI
jgi:hypothetical protein